MKQKILKNICITMACAFFVTTQATARDLNASFALIPGYVDNLDKGVLIELVKKLETELGNRIERQVVPFARSMDNVVKRRVDFHLPLIKRDGDTSGLPFDYSTETIFHVNFVLYANKDKPLDMANLGSYKLETDRAHVEYFPFPIEPTSNLESSLKKVSAGRIDGFIFADLVSDGIIKKHGLNNISRALYKTFDVKIVLPKGGRGGEVDQLLSKSVAALRDNGAYDQIMGPVNQPYNDWQP